MVHPREGTACRHLNTWRQPFGAHSEYNKAGAARVIKSMNPSSASQADTDTAALQAYLSGNLNALDDLIRRYRTPLYGYALSMSGHPAEADDIFQETWLRVIRHAGRFRRGTFQGWMMRIAHNVAVDRFRRRRPTASLDKATDAQGGETLLNLIADPQPDAAQQLESTDQQTRIWRAIDQLPVEQREVFVLRTQSELPFKTIAAIQGVPLNTALGRMHYAVQRLRQRLAPPNNPDERNGDAT